MKIALKIVFMLMMVLFISYMERTISAQSQNRYVCLQACDADAAGCEQSANDLYSICQNSAGSSYNECLLNANWDYVWCMLNGVGDCELNQQLETDRCNSWHQAELYSCFNDYEMAKNWCTFEKNTCRSLCPTS
jgi:hypothetical protein